MTDITDTLEENSASDIVADAKAWLADIGGGQRLQTHSGNCHKWHSTCLVVKLTREIERLRTLATHATPSEGSVQNGCTLTDAEREAVEWYANFPDGIHADTLRKLLERLTHDAVPEAKANADGEPAPKCGGEAGLSSRDGTGNTHTLTDAEREAIETAVRWLEPYPQVASTLRKLLERIGGER